MFWYIFTFVAVGLYAFANILSTCLQFLSIEIPPIRELKEQHGITKIKFFPISIPYLDGLYSLYVFKKQGMSVFDHYQRKLPNEKVYQLDAGPFKLLISGDATICSKILSSTNPAHLSRPKFLQKLVFFLKSSIVFTPYKTWNNQRKIVSRAFTFRCIQSYMKTIDFQSKHLVITMIESVKMDIDAIICGQNIINFISTSALKIALEFIVGSSEEISDSEEAANYVQDLLEFKEIACEIQLHPEYYIPLFWWLHPKRRRVNNLEKRMLAFVNKVIDYYQLQSTTKSENVENTDVKSRRCLVEEMVTSGATPEQIFNEIATFLIAGHESITAAMNILLHHLACHPDYQERCREEIDAVLGPNSGLVGDELKHLDIAKLSKLKYLDMCILESLSLAPTFPFTARELDTSLKINDDLTLEKGQVFVVSPWLIHHNPKYYPNPETFDPDRFLPEAVKKREPGAYIPFTAGYRNCIGRRLAMLELKTLTAWILRNFVLTTVDGLHEVKFGFEVTVKPERPYRTMLKMRNAHE